MSWAKIVKKACSGLNVSYSGTNSEGYVPDAGEPHLHCGGDFIVYTSSGGHSHSQIADGNGMRDTAQGVSTLLASSTNPRDADIKKVVDYLVATYK